MTRDALSRAERALWACALLAAVGASAVLVLGDGDVPWLIRTGEEIVRRGALPRDDPFAYTPRTVPLHHEYLTEVLLYGLYRAGGVLALTAAQCLLLVAFVLAAAQAPTPEGRARPFGGASALALAAGAMLLRELLTLRAQSLSDVLTTLVFVAVLRDHAGDARALPATLPLGLVWAQLHGGNPHHTVLLGLGWLAAPTRRRFGYTVAAAALTCASPNGPRVHAHYLHGTPSLHLIKEWQPLHRVLASGNAHAALCVAFALAAAASLAWRRRRGERVRVEALALAFYALLAARYARGLHELTALATVCLVRGLYAVPRERVAHVAAALLVAGAAQASGQVRGVGFGGRYSPAAFAWLAAHRPAGPMFNSYNLGGWLMLRYPQERVFVDSRGPTVYPAWRMAELQALYRDPPRFEALTARYGFRLAVLQRDGLGASLVAHLRAHPAWQLRHEDARVIIFTRAH